MGNLKTYAKIGGVGAASLLASELVYSLAGSPGGFVGGAARFGGAGLGAAGSMWLLFKRGGKKK